MVSGFEFHTNILKIGKPLVAAVRRALPLGFVLVMVIGSFAVLTVAPPAAAAGQISQYMTGLNVPIALGFASDGRIFFAERNTGSIRIIEGGVLLGTPFYTLPNTDTAGERGLLGLALDPDFPSTAYVYAYQTFINATSGTTYNRVVRIVASGNVGVSDTVILRLPPLSSATNHNGGVIAFGPDGKLFVDVGENANIALAQDLTTPMGKVLRMNTDGSPPTDNPFYGSPTANQLIYSYGHRNMFGLTFHPATGRVYVTENGPGCNDEINLLPNLTATDRNLGWGTTQTCSTPPPPPQNTNQDGPNPILPIWWWGATICPTNAAIYWGPYFPAWRGDMFMGDCNNRRFHRLHLVPPDYTTVASDTIIWTAPSYILDVEVGPDGAIWITTPSTIYRYWDSGQPPVASFTATPNPALVGSPVAFDASASSDPDGTIVWYNWTFGDTTTGSGVTASHTYATVGTYNTTLTVTDNESFTATTYHNVVVQAPPTGSFTVMPNPAVVGATVNFDASASSDPDGTIISYAWEFGDSSTGSQALTSHPYASPGTFRVNLTVADNDGLTATTSKDVDIQPAPPGPRPPVANFTAGPSPVNPGSPVTFDATASYDPDGTISSYSWDFGDLSAGTGVTQIHAYSTSGVYTITLTVVDNQSLSSSAVHQVSVNRPPHAAMQFAPTAIYMGTIVTFDASPSTDSDGIVVSFTWDFGDSFGGNGAQATHSYSTKGTFIVTLTVGDNLGLSNDTSSAVVVQNRAPQITSSVPGPGPVTVAVGATRTFTIAGSDPDGDALTYAWRISGAAVGGNTAAFNFTLATPGTYTLNVTLSDGTLADWRQWTVTVTGAAPAPSLLASAWPFVVLAVLLLTTVFIVWWRRRKRETAPPRGPPGTR